MAEISSAILCDFAQVREGLLFVSSGAITRAYRNELPAAMEMMAAIIVEVGAEERNLVHELDVVVKHVESVEVLARLTGGFQLGASDLEPGESIYCPVVVDLRQVGLLKHGIHDVQFALNDGPRQLLTFYVRSGSGQSPADAGADPS